MHVDAGSRIKYLDTTADSDSRSLETMSTTSSRDDPSAPSDRTSSALLGDAALGNVAFQKKKKNSDPMMRPYTKRRRKKNALGHIKPRTSGCETSAAVKNCLLA